MKNHAPYLAQVSQCSFTRSETAKIHNVAVRPVPGLEGYMAGEDGQIYFQHEAGLRPVKHCRPPSSQYGQKKSIAGVGNNTGTYILLCVEMSLNSAIFWNNSSGIKPVW
jgi:hypothetical protein